MDYLTVLKATKQVVKTYRMKLTLRQIYYRLVSAQVIPNTRTSYQQLSKVLVRARERGDLDERAIEDRSRQVLGIGDYGYESPQSFLDAQLERLKSSWDNYTRPMWESQICDVVIALEKDALSRLFVSVANRFRVKVFATRGYSSFTYVRQMVSHMNKDTDTYVLYFGDLDPSGRDIERDLGARLTSYGAQHFSLDRIALTPKQVEALKLPPKPEDIETLAKLSRDTRSKRYGLEYAVELDAIEPTTLGDLVEKAIQNHIDPDTWNEQRHIIEKEKTQLRHKLEDAKVTYGDEET